jgi:hypothetical protein
MKKTPKGEDERKELKEKDTRLFSREYQEKSKEDRLCIQDTPFLQDSFSLFLSNGVFFLTSPPFCPDLLETPLGV